VTISASTFLGNSAGDGAAVFSNSGAVTIGNSTFSNNTAANRGGAVAIATGSVTIVNSTLTGNSASASGGGGIYGNATIENTIVANNQAGGARNCNGVITAGIDSLSDDATCGAATVKTLAQINFGNLTGRPAYFQLNPGSAAIDAGNNAYCAAPPVNNTSQNGVTRPVGAACDIGSYEAPAGVSAAATSIPTMSAAGMILLSGLLAFFGMVKTRHRWLRSVHIRVHR
jgi:predicted outer membrane repeat protein